MAVASVIEAGGYEAVKRTILLGRLPPPETIDPRAFADALAATGDERLSTAGEAEPAGEAKRRAAHGVAKAEREGGGALREGWAAGVAPAGEAVGSVVPPLPPLPQAGETPVAYLRACAAAFAAILRERGPTAIPRLEKMGADLRKLAAAQPADERVKELRALVGRAAHLLKAEAQR